MSREAFTKAGIGILSAVILAEMLLILTAGFRRQGAADRTKQLAVSVVGPTHLWTMEVGQVARQEIRELSEEKNWKISFDAADNSGDQSRRILELLDQHIECLVLMPMDGASLKTAAVMAQQKGVPVVIFDREIPDFVPSATVKGDNYGIGEKTALHFNKSFPKGTTVLEIMGDTSTVPYQRMDGYNDNIADNIVTIEIGYAGWQRETSREIFRRWVAGATEAQKEAVGAVFTHDDEIALGVLDVLDGYARAHSGEKLLPNLTVIAGSSNSREFYRRISKEKQYELFSLRYAPEMMEEAIRVASEIVEGEEYEDLVIFPTVEVNSHNVAEYLADR